MGQNVAYARAYSLPLLKICFPVSRVAAGSIEFHSASVGLSGWSSVGPNIASKTTTLALLLEFFLLGIVIRRPLRRERAI